MTGDDQARPTRASDQATARSAFAYAPDPEMPGWWTWDLEDRGRFNAIFGKLRVRTEGERHVRLRFWPERRHTNVANVLHGGLIAGLADVSFFATCRALTLFEVSRAATVDMTLQYLTAGRVDRPLDVVGEVLQETGRMVFLRGLMVQGEDDGARVAAFTGTIRKPAPPKAAA